MRTVSLSIYRPQQKVAYPLSIQLFWLILQFRVRRDLLKHSVIVCDIQLTFFFLGKVFNDLTILHNDQTIAIFRASSMWWVIIKAVKWSPVTNSSVNSMRATLVLGSRAAVCSSRSKSSGRLSVAIKRLRA